MQKSFFEEIRTPPPSGFEAAGIADRLPAFDGMSAGAPEVLAKIDITVIGDGAVGGAAAEMVARLRVGTLRNIDPGAFKPQSLLTHFGVMPQDVGIPKAIAIGERCKRISPGTRVLVHTGGIESVPPAALADTDLVLLATDNLPAEVAAGQLCASLAKPLIQMSVDGTTLVAQVRVLLNRGGGACPRCLYGSIEEEHLRSGSRFSCDGLIRAAAQPTMSVSPLCAMAASMGILLGLRHILRLGRPLDDALHEFCGYTSRSCESALTRRPDCPQDHTPWTTVRLERSLADTRPAELAAFCGVDLGSLDFEFEGIRFAESGICSAGHFVRINEPVNGQAHRRACPACGAAVEVPRMSMHDQVPGSMLESFGGLPIARVLPAEPRWAIARSDRSTSLILGAPTGQEAA